MEGGGGRGEGEKNSDFLLHIVLLLIKYVCCLYGQEKKCPYKYNFGSFARVRHIPFFRQKS